MKEPNAPTPQESHYPIAAKCECPNRCFVHGTNKQSASEGQESYLPPLGDRTHHLETDDVMAAIEGTEYLKGHVANKLHLMTSGERYSLYRAVVKLVDERRAAKAEKAEGDK